jgi:type I restriction enzyme S subunit
MTREGTALKVGLQFPRGFSRSTKFRWQLRRIGDYVRLNYGKALTATDRHAGPIRVFGSNGQCGWHNEALAKGPGVILGRKGQGPLGVEWCDDDFWVIDTAYFVAPISEDISLKFFFYATQYIGLNHLKDGTSNPSLSREVFYNQAFPVPPLYIQNRIAELLSFYDDLIDVNNRRISILDEMARRIYRDWFVKFRFPGHASATFYDSRLGRIPKDWRLASLADLMIHNIGGGWGQESAADDFNSPAWVIRGTDIPLARHSRLDNVPLRYHTTSNLRSRMLAAGDIVFEVSGGSKGQPVGRTLLLTEELLEAFDAPVICASFCKRVCPNTEAYGSELMYLSFQDAYVSGEIEQYQVQSTGISNFKWTEYIHNTYRPVPPAPVRAKFAEVTRPLFAQISTLGKLSANLSRTRDLLLPKLMSGELDVSTINAEQLTLTA